MHIVHCPDQGFVSGFGYQIFKTYPFIYPMKIDDIGPIPKWGTGDIVCGKRVAEFT
jgi:hypothetical protein